MPKFKKCLTIISFMFDFRSTKAFMVKRLEAEGAEVVFHFLSLEHVY